MASSARWLLVGAVLLLGGCGEQAEVIDLGPVSEAPEPDEVVRLQDATPHAQRQVQTPSELDGRYRQVRLSLQLPGGEAQAFDLPLDGKSHEVAGGTLLARDYLPAFLIRGGEITSDGLEEKNPAVYLEWRHQGRLLFKGWCFRNYPDLNTVKTPGYQLRLLAAR